MKIAFNPSTVAALTAPPNNKDITFDLRGRNIFARGVKFYGTDTNTWRDIKVNNVSIGSHTLDLRNGSNTTLTNTNGIVTINSTWRPVVDNLTSDSTTSSLSAKQGKVLKALIDGKSNSDHNHDGRYVRKSGDTMSGVLIIDTTNFGALAIKRSDDVNGASIQFRGKSSVYGYIGLNNSNKNKQFLRWNSDISKVYTILDTSSTYTSSGKGVINGTTITQVDNATNATNSTNARKLVNWYSARPTSLNAQFGDGSLRIFYATSSTTVGKCPADATVLHLAWDHNGGWDSQLAVGPSSNRIYSRSQNNGTWQSWKTVAFTTDIPNKNSWNYDDRYYTKAESNAKYITDITTSVNKLTFTKNGSSIARTITVNNVQSLGRRNPLTERNAISGIYTYGTYSATDNLAPTNYFETLGFGEGAAGTIEIGGSWISGGKLYWRALRDYQENWFSWKTILDSSNYSSILDSRYYTESEVNSLLSNKLNTSNFNWTNLPGKIVAGNEFNIVSAGFKEGMWFNYLPINDRNKTATISSYHFGNGAKGYTSIIASGFIKRGGNASQLLRADGGVAAFNWSGQAGQPTWLWGGNSQHSYYVYNPSNFRVAYAASAGNSDKLDGYHENSFLRYRGATNKDQEATLWSQIGIKEYQKALPDSLTSVYNFGSVISLSGLYSRFEIYASHQSSKGNGLYYRSGWANDKQPWRKFIDSSNIGSQSVNYANSAGSASSADKTRALKYTGTGNSEITAFQTAASYMGRSGWASYIICNHGDGSTYYSQTIAFPFWGSPIYRRLEGGTNKGWKKFYTEEAPPSWAEVTDKPSSLKNPYAIKFKDINGNVATYDGSAAKDLTAGTYIAKLPYGFASFTSGVTWGNTTGTSFASWNDSTGGSIDFRRDNPSKGKMSIKVDGRVYVNEGANPVLSAEYGNSFWGMRTPDGGNDWIRTPNNGLIPYVSGGAGGGHSSLGTSTWYFSTAYIDKVYGSLKGNADSATSTTKVIVSQHITNDVNYPLVWSNQSNTNNATENQLFKSWADLYYNPKNKRLCVAGSAIIGASAVPSYTLDVRGSVIASSWLRTRGAAGWYSESYGGGIYMSDTAWIRTFGDKPFYCNKQIYSSDSIRMGDIYLQNKKEINNGANGDLYLNYRNTGDIILCNGGGKVGIGKSDPLYKLDVAGNGRFQDFVYCNAVYSNTLNHTSPTGHLIIGNKTEEISIRSSHLPDIPAVYLYQKFSTNVYYTANKGFGIRPYYLSSRDYRSIETISGNEYSVVTVGDSVQAISCIIADKANLAPQIRGTLIRFLPGDDGQIVLLKDLNNYGSINGYFYVQPKGCNIIRPNNSNISIADGNISGACNDGKSRFFIYAKTHKVWIEFYCG